MRDRGRERRRSSASTSWAAALMMACLPAIAAAAPASPAAAHIHVIGAGEGEAAVAARLHDLLDEEVSGLVVDGAPSFHDDEPLRTDADAGAPVAWLVLEGTHARVRAAGAGRTRFVFRDLEVGQPLSEFDRERLGQSVKAALGTLVSGGPGTLSRADAAAASGVTPAAVPPPPVAAPTAPPPPESELRFRLGAFYQAESLGNGLFHGPGVIATLDDSRWPYAPELWLTGGYDLQRDYGNQLASLTIDALWTRAGLSLRLAGGVRLGAGLGLDRQTIRLTTMDPRVVANPGNGTDVMLVGRLVGRAGPARVAGVDVSLTAFLDVSRSTERDIYLTTPNVPVTLYHSNNLRPGFSLDLWWR